MTGLTTLPKAKQSRTSLDITPLNARVMLASTPKCGKTTLASEWAPDTTLAHRHPARHGPARR
jgi:hypothetical protein